jgi:methylated-DNA-[protein]-cysteine S-methyltransferase
MKKKNKSPIIISTHNHENLYYAVGFSESGKIVRITLPQKSVEEAIYEISMHHPKFLVSDEYSETARMLCEMFHGKDVHVDIRLLELDIDESSSETSTIKTPFERDVIVEVSKIPHGNIKTYKEIARSVNSQAYRAVGTAISKNPFPILVPCHRVVRSDGKVGGFRGGTQMKVEILENEGIKIDALKIKPKS